jgi:prefoldin subunit 5
MQLAIKILEKRIEEYKSELVKLSFLKPESLGDIEFLESDTKNINLQITELQKAIKVLVDNI